MKKTGIKIGVALLVLVSMMSIAYAAESSNTAPADYKPVPSSSQINPSTQGVKKILLIEDQLPWGFNSSHDALTALGLPYDIVTAAGLPNVIWNDYSQVIVSSDQPQYLYDALGPYISPGGALYNWVAAGGVLNFHAASWGWQGSNWTAAFNLPGGISAVNDYQDDVNVTGPAIPLPPARGPVKAITDADLDYWSASTHGYFKYVGGDPIKPSSAVVTLTVTGAPTKPVYIIYKFDKGVVLATVQTLEWVYSGNFGTPDSKYALLNDLGAGRIIDNLIS